MMLLFRRGKDWLIFCGQIVFAELMGFLSIREFHKCVHRYRGLTLSKKILI